MNLVGSWRASNSQRQAITAVVRDRAEVLVLAALLALSVALKLLSARGIPVGVFGLGAVDGATIAIQAIGLVLVYRTNRIVNFAQVAVGLAGGALFFELVRTGRMLLAVRAVCPTCFDVRRINVGEGTITVPDNVPGWLLQANFWLSFGLSLAVVALLSWGSYALIIRRFANAPRLIATVVTIGLAQVFDLFRAKVPGLFGIPVQSTGTVPIPFKTEFRFGGVIFGTTDVISVVVAVVALVGLTLFFTRSAMGVVLRGAAENPQRAETLGVNVAAVSSVVWVAAGCLSGIAAILAATDVGVGAAAGIERLLAAAVVGSLTSIPITVLAGLVLGIADNAIVWVTRSSAMVDALVLAVIVTVFLVQRSRSSRVDTEDDTGWKASRETRPIPTELRSLEVVQRWLRFGRIACVLVVLGIPWALSPAQTNLAAVTVIYGIVAMSLLVLTGWAGQISLGHFAFAAVGAWVTAVAKAPFPISVLLSGLVGAAVAVVVGMPALRLRGLHLAVSTIAFAVATTSILVSPDYLGKHLPATLERPRVLGLALEDQRTFYYFALFFLALVVVGVVGLRHSRTARALIGARDNEAAAQAYGINLMRARLGAFAVSGFLAAFAGGLYAYSQYGVNVQSFTPAASIKVFLMVVIGGLGSVAGPLLGAAYIGVAEIFGGGNILIALGATGIGVITLLLFLPGGLADLVFRLRDAMLRRVAARYRIEVPSLIADRRAHAADHVPIAPKARPGGGTVFVPRRYRIDGQWAVKDPTAKPRRDAASAPSKEAAGV